MCFISVCVVFIKQFASEQWREVRIFVVLLRLILIYTVSQKNDTDVAHYNFNAEKFTVQLSIWSALWAHCCFIAIS